MSKVSMPKRLAALMARAKKKPVVINAGLLDQLSVVRRQCLPNIPLGEVLAWRREATKGATSVAKHQLQRNTEGRLANLKKTAYLRHSDFVPTPQQHVQFVWWKDVLETVDGDHRLTLWADPGENVLRPADVDVTIHYPKDEAEYNLVYRCIDSGDSRKTNQDNIYGILNAIGLKPQSELFLANRIVTALLHVSAKENTPDDLLQAAREWREELHVLDSYMLLGGKRYTYSSGVWAGLLMLLRNEVDRELLRSYAVYLRQARRFGDTENMPVAIKGFLDAYCEMKSPGVSSNVPKVVALTVEYFNKFSAGENALTKKRGATKVKRAASLTLVA